MKSFRIPLILLTLFAFVCAVRPASFEPGRAAKRQVRWYKKTIQFALSTSLTAENTSIRPQSDVAGAVHRALATWSAVTNIQFVEVSSDVQSISKGGRGDGINLITIAATPQNMAIFHGDNSPARTRVFYDSETGEITEADIAINPYAYSLDGAPLDFSTDGTAGTYDLQSTLTHEIGHVLGLNHSAVFGSTMNASQALNGVFGLPAFGMRTLSESDRAAAVGIYGSGNDTGSVEGRILNTRQGSLEAASSASVWIEDSVSGRVMASDTTDANGDFKIAGLTPGTYRLLVQSSDPKSESGNSARAADSFRAIEIANQLRITANRVTPVSYVLVPPQNTPAAVRARFIGNNNELSTVSLPALRGTKVTVYVSGDAVDQIVVNGVLISSPYLTVNPASVAVHQYNNSRSLSFDVTVATDAPDGDYSIKLQANTGETTFLIGALTVAVPQ
ncbi:MAG TPA: matrixin family metalloprotease [Pyrinomonadaceae bacterium]|nr:matrixin family metalloprotease [Pyrinomonadaceae bacterium]